ncbi:MAG: ankyrin repeat domain-containing protein [Alphaproteobacteria bacterium]|nr:ankyrin repeat domain-containing protein [Alphaproteobacteria bacterium]
MLKSVLFSLLLVCTPLVVFAQTDEVTTSEVVAEFENTDLEEQMATADVAFLEKLKNEGFDFNQKDINGNAPLYYILYRNPDLEVAKKAIEFGADVNMPAKNGMIPLNIATSKANELQLQIMMMKTMGLNTEEASVQEEIKKNLFLEMTRVINMTKLLIENGADVNLASSLGTPLMNAVTNVWNLDIVKMLIDAKADLNATDKNGRTALFYAFASSNDEVVELLINSGADVSVKDNEGKTYLEMQKLSVAPAI